MRYCRNAYFAAHRRVFIVKRELPPLVLMKNIFSPCVFRLEVILIRTRSRRDRDEMLTFDKNEIKMSRSRQVYRTASFLGLPGLHYSTLIHNTVQYSIRYLPKLQTIRQCTISNNSNPCFAWMKEGSKIEDWSRDVLRKAFTCGISQREPRAKEQKSNTFEKGEKRMG